jgi:hypothetical protein
MILIGRVGQPWACTAPVASASNPAAAAAMSFFICLSPDCFEDSLVAIVGRRLMHVN